MTLVKEVPTVISDASRFEYNVRDAAGEAVGGGVVFARDEVEAAAQARCWHRGGTVCLADVELAGVAAPERAAGSPERLG